MGRSASRGERKSGTRLRVDVEADQDSPRLRELDEARGEVRERASTLREQGWKWELSGRAWAYKEAAKQVRKWLLDPAAVPDRSRVEFVVELLEGSAAVYEAADRED